jgi:oligopeptide/dipeptide ABC transporter ATP-binding protein
VSVATAPASTHADDASEAPALAVAGLTTSIRIERQWFDAVRDVSFDVHRRETLALVGEAGCGKRLTALSVMGLLPAGVGRVTRGRIAVDGIEMTGASDAQVQAMRGDRIGMVFQEPMTSLNPVLPVGFQIAESLVEHRGMGSREARRRALELMELVRIPAAAERLDAYPHQFSGGMRQRVMIAIALACAPKVLIADEPTTALDVTIQAQVLALLADLQRREGLAVLLITHNLGVVASVADRVMVMYGGDVVETASVDEFFRRPTHPYSEALLAAMPRVDRSSDALAPIPGQVPGLPEMPSGCRFQSRCPLRTARCVERPPLTALADAPTHHVRCWVRAPEQP